MARTRVDACIILYDPSKLGGFRRGAVLSNEETRTMLRMSNFTIGTILQRKGLLWRVEWRPYWRKKRYQKVVLVEEALTDG